MKLYFAGRYTGFNNLELLQLGIKNKLFSFHNEKELLKQDHDYDNLIMDSGAFSAFTQKAKIDLMDYLNFCNEIKPTYAIQLDVIGNEELTWNNWVSSEELYQTMPVIHYGASKKHIQRVLLASDYICLGALVPLSKNKKLLEQWLNYIFSFKEIRNKKIHCLGITTKSILEKFPFFSCDSSSALSIQRYPSKDIYIKMIQKTYHYKDTYIYGIKEQLELEKYITSLWEQRGVKFTE